MPSILFQVVSGGQTGVDRAGLDAAIFHSIPHGGWCPEGRRAEDGKIPDRYQLRENGSRNYAIRTRQNVKDSDGTLILFKDSMSRGTELTSKCAGQLQRPLCCVDVAEFSDWSDDRFEEELQQADDWIYEHQIKVLNIAGPRESTSPGIGAVAEAFLVRLFKIKISAK